MKVQRSLIHPNSFGVTYDEDEVATNQQVNEAIQELQENPTLNSVEVAPSQTLTCNQLETTDASGQDFDEPIEPLVPASIYDGQGEAQLSDNSGCDDDTLVPPVINFEKPKEKKQEDEIDTVDNCETLLPPVINFEN